MLNLELNLEELSPKQPDVSGAVSKVSRSAGACRRDRNLGGSIHFQSPSDTVMVPKFQRGVDPSLNIISLGVQYGEDMIECDPA